jgi:hypothetical protein
MTCSNGLDPIESCPNTDGLYHKAGPLQQTHRRVADEDALTACVESGLERDRHLALLDPLAF